MIPLFDNCVLANFAQCNKMFQALILNLLRQRNLTIDMIQSRECIYKNRFLSKNHGILLYPSCKTRFIQLLRDIFSRDLNRTPESWLSNIYFGNNMFNLNILVCNAMLNGKFKSILLFKSREKIKLLSISMHLLKTYSIYTQVIPFSYKDNVYMFL